MSAAPYPYTSDDTLNWASAWDGMLQAQQRFWSEWAEASQLWTSWWWSQMPPLTAISAASWPTLPGLLVSGDPRGGITGLNGLTEPLAEPPPVLTSTVRPRPASTRHH